MVRDLPRILASPYRSPLLEWSPKAIFYANVASVNIRTVTHVASYSLDNPENRKTWIKRSSFTKLWFAWWANQKLKTGPTPKSSPNNGFKLGHTGPTPSFNLVISPKQIIIWICWRASCWWMFQHCWWWKSLFELAETCTCELQAWSRNLFNCSKGYTARGYARTAPGGAPLHPCAIFDTETLTFAISQFLNSQFLNVSIS